MAGKGIPWAQASTDYKLLFAVWIPTMAMFMLRPVVWVQAAVIGAPAVTVVVISVIYRIRDGWRWRPPRGLETLGAMVSIAAVLALGFGLLHFAGSAFGLNERTLFAWRTGILILGAFKGLTSLHLVRTYQAQYDGDCAPDGDLAIAAAPNAAPNAAIVAEGAPVEWRPWIQRGFARLAFFAGVASVMFGLYYFDVLKTAPHLASGAQTLPFTDAEVTVYLNAPQLRLITAGQWALISIWPAIALAGLYLQFVLKLSVFGGFEHLFRRTESMGA